MDIPMPPPHLSLRKDEPSTVTTNEFQVNDNADNMKTVDLRIGETYATEFAIDTTSPWISTTSSACKNCKKQYYRTSSAITWNYLADNSTKTIYEGTKRASVAEPVKEKVCIESSCIEKQLVKVITRAGPAIENYQAAGLWGLSPYSESTSENSFLHSLYVENQIDSPQFTLQFQSSTEAFAATWLDGEQKNRMTIGQLPADLSSVTKYSTSVIINEDSNSQTWTIPRGRVQYGGGLQLAAAGSAGQATFASYQPYLGLPRTMLRKLYDQFDIDYGHVNTICRSDSDSYCKMKSECSALDLQPFLIQLGSNTYYVPSSAYAVDFNGYCEVLIVDSEYYGFKDNEVMLGWPFLSLFDSTFNNADYTVTLNINAASANTYSVCDQYGQNCSKDAPASWYVEVEEDESSGGAMIGIVIAGIVVVLVASGIGIYCCKKNKTDSADVYEQV